MTIFNMSNEAISSLTIASLHALADGAYWESNVITTSGFVELFLQGKLKTNNVSGSPTGFSNVFVAARIDVAAGEFGGLATGSEGVFTANPNASAQTPNMNLIDTVQMLANEATERDYTFNPRPIAPAFGGVLPPEIAIVIENQTGDAYSGSGSYLTIGGVVGVGT